jgi:DNA replicative helicase MCM subunit Mcm2 (Cdc46/Mcm family)
VIYAIRDPIEKPKRGKGRGQDGEAETVVVDQGVQDKRLLVYEAEYSGPLRVQRREGNILSPMLRQGWESGDLRVLTKNSPVRATGAHISIISHITRDELRRELTATDQANGYANRHLFVCVKRSKLLPLGGCVDKHTRQALTNQLRLAAEFARNAGAMKFSKKAKALWYRKYPKLSSDSPGLLGAITSRAEAQVIRLSLIYALLGCSAVIKTQHLHAALAVWRYCQDSARYIFGSELGDPIADRILRELRRKSNGLTKTEIRSVFSRNLSEAEINRALGVLSEHGFAKPEAEETGGRPSERWLAVT